MVGKRGYFFVIDAIVAATILLFGLFILFGSSVRTQQDLQPFVSIEDFMSLNSMNVYPNPAQDILNISTENGDLPDSFVIYNSLGQTMAQVKVGSNANLTVNTSAYSNGIYFIKIDKGSQSKTVKFIKN